MKKPLASRYSFVSASAVAAALFATSTALHAAGAFTWTGATNGAWSTATNWTGSGNITSDNQTDLIIDSTNKTLSSSGSGSYLGGSRTIRSLTFTSNITAGISTSFNWFDNTPYNLTLSAATGNASITVNAGETGAISLGAASGVGGAWGNLVLSSNLDVIHNGSGQLTLNRSVTGTGALTKTGIGTLAFTSNATSANTYSGLTTVSGGNLTVAKTAGLDAIAGNLLVTGTGTFNIFQTSNQIKDTVNVEVATGGIFNLVGTSTITANETVNNLKLTGGSITSSGNASNTLISTTAFDLQSGNSSARLTGTAGAIKSTSGTVILSGGHTLSGNITVNEGTLQLAGFNNLTGANLIVNGGALYASTSGNASQDIDSASSLNLNGGTLRINPNFAAGNFKNCNTLPVVVNSPSTLSYENGANYSISLGFGGTAGFVLNSGLVLQNNSSNTTVSSPMTFSRNITGTGSLTVNTYNNINSAAASYTLGRVVISGNNAGWSGDLVVAKGTASLGSTVTTSGGGSGNIVLGETGNSFGAGLTLSANSPTVSGTQTISKNIIVRSGGFRSIRGNSDNSYSLTGNVTLEGDLNVDLSLFWYDKSVVLSGNISGPGGLDITRANNTTPLSYSGDYVRLSGNNTYTGPTTVTSGLLEVRNSGTSSISVASGAGLRFTLNDGLTPVATTTGNLTLSSNNTVNIYGTPAPSTNYTLLSAASISGPLPTLVYITGNVTGYSLVVEGNALKLKSDTVADTTAPDAPSVSLLASSDSGTSGTDRITKVTIPTIRVTFAGTGATAPVEGDVVKLYEGTTLVASATLAAGDIILGYVDLTTSVLAQGSLSFTATVTDAASNVSAASAAVVVTLDTTAPVISLIGSASTPATWGTPYSDAGATATDNVDSTVSVVPVNPVATSTPGVYSVTYNATDVAGNSATQVTRTVTVTISNPSTVGADGLSPLMKYAFGATSPSDTVQAPVTSATATELKLTAVVRTNDSNLNVTAETNTDLAVPASWTGTGITEALAADQTNLPAGCVRKVYSVSITGASKKFLRIKAASTF